MVPIPESVKAEIVGGGSGNTDYRHHSKVLGFYHFRLMPCSADGVAEYYIGGPVEEGQKAAVRGKCRF
jgi:hypothetical protein